MASVVDKAHVQFQTDRLVFTAFDHLDDSRDAWVLDNILNDPEVFALCDSTLLKPHGKAHADQFNTAVNNCLVSCFINLRDESDPHDDDGSDDEKKKKSRLTRIGIISLNAPSPMAGPGGASISSQHRTASLAIAIASPWQGRGYGPEAIRWLVDLAFRHAGMHTVTISAFSFNARAAGLYERAGFTLDGRLRQTVWFDRRWYDRLFFTMTEDEWEAQREGTQQ